MGEHLLDIDTDRFVAEAAEPAGPIRPLATGLYEPTVEHGLGIIDLAFFVPVVSWPDVLDIVAWEWNQPFVWWLRLGEAMWLGDHQFRRNEGRILLVETPADYVQNRGACACVLDWGSVDLVDAFHKGPPVVFASDRLRRKFDRRWGEQVEAEREAAVPRYKVPR